MNGARADERPFVLSALASLVTVVTVIALLVGGYAGRVAVLAAAVAVVALYLVAVHPRVVVVAFAAVLGAAPYMHVPGTELPALLALCAGLWLAWLLLPDTRVRLGWPELAVIAIAVVAAMSVVATRISAQALIEVTAWLAATSVVIPLCRLPERLRTSLGRAFAASAVVGAAVGFAILLGAPGSFRRLLRPLGYDATGNVRQISDDRLTERLTGTYLEPNVAGLILLVALLVAAGQLTGRWRAVAVGVIGLALLLTLSRAAIAAAAVAGLVTVVRTPRFRTQLIALGAGTLGVALLIPRVRERLLGSFGANDVGFSDRVAALHAFPDQVSGHWWWGLGWDRPEFRDSVSAAATNFVANGPLLTIYRGGLVLGALVTVIAVAVAVRAWLVAGRSLESALLAGGVIGVALVAFQLDFPIVNQIPATTVTSLLLALLVVAGRTPNRARDA